MFRFVAAFFATVLASSAYAQSGVAPKQSGNVTGGHAAYWITNGSIADAGTANDSKLSSLGVTNNGGPGICVSSAPLTAAARNQLCLAATTNGGTKISSYIYGTATSPGITFDINGSVQGFPTVTLPVVSGDIACFDGITGQLKDCGVAPVLILPVDVRFYGAVCDGVTDDHIAIQSDMNINKGALIPGTCSIGSSTLTFGNLANATLTGINPGSSVLTSTSTTAPMISVTATIPGLVISHLGLTRSVVATTGATGILYNGFNDLPVINDVDVQKQFIGISLSSTGYGKLQQSYVHNNVSDGVVMQNPTIAGQFQWYLDTVLSSANGGWNYSVLAPPTAAISSQVTMGTWTNTFSFSGFLGGVRFEGNSNVSVQGIRINGGFWGTDAGAEGRFNTFNTAAGPHQITGLFAEINTNGTCMQFTANNNTVGMTGGAVIGCNTSGIVNSATVLTVTGTDLVNNNTFGIVNNTIAVVTGSNLNNNTSGPVSNAGTYTGRGNTPASANTPFTVAEGGTGLASGTSGGVLCFTAATTTASSVALTANAIMLGGGAGACPTPLGSLGTTTTVLHGNAAGPPTFGAVANADLTNSATTVNGQICTLGAACTISASATSITVGTTTVVSGAANGILFDTSGGILASTSGVSGGLLNSSSVGVPQMTITPILGVAGSSVGTLGFQNATSGTVTIQPPAGAMGTVTLTLPVSTSDVLVNRSSVDTFTNKTFNSTATGNVLQVSGVTVSAGQYPGEPTTGNATAGNVGEYLESVIAFGSAVAVATTATPQNITGMTITLTAGDWDVSAELYMYDSASTVLHIYDIVSVSTTTGALDLTNGRFAGRTANSTNISNNILSGAGVSVPIGPHRRSVSGSTQLFATVQCAFTGAGTPTVFGVLRARRVR